MDSPPYRRIADYYERCLAEHGDTHLGVDWPRAADARARYRIMLEVVRPPVSEQVSLLDLGCGAGHLYEYLLENPLPHIQYQGLDISEPFVALCRQKHPLATFTCADVLAQDVPVTDYTVMNGVFTVKGDLAFDTMQDFLHRMLRRTFAAARRGIAFNLISKQVDWEVDKLFHVPLDTLAWFITKELTRNFVIRNDYGLYEYTTYVYK
jgi:SAM-dependent methyltransferase